MNTTSLQSPSLRNRVSGAAAATPATSVLHRWIERAQSRRDLRKALHFYASLGGSTPWTDLGGSRGELLHEAEKPFWRT